MVNRGETNCAAYGMTGLILRATTAHISAQVPRLLGAYLDEYGLPIGQCLVQESVSPSMRLRGVHSYIWLALMSGCAAGSLTERQKVHR